MGNGFVAKYIYFGCIHRFGDAKMQIRYVGNAADKAALVRGFVDDAYTQYSIQRGTPLDAHIYQVSPDGCVFVWITGRDGRYVITGRNGIKSISGVLCRICGQQLLCSSGIKNGMCRDCARFLNGGDA